MCFVCFVFSPQEKIKRIQQIRMEKEMRAQQILEVRHRSYLCKLSIYPDLLPPVHTKTVFSATEIRSFGKPCPRWRFLKALISVYLCIHV